VGRLESRAAALEDASGDVVADTLRLEADAIAGEALLGHARLGRAGVDALAFPPDRPLDVATIGNYGPLAGGMVGTALGVVLAAHADGRPIHVWVAETRPLLDGARLTALELARAGVDHTIVADGALATLIASGRVDVVLLGAERVAANGDTCGVLGTYGVAAVAAGRVPVFVAAPASTLDLDRADATELPLESRAATELTEVRGTSLANRGSPVLNPIVDVTPAGLIDAFLTDEGVLRAPFAPALSRAAADAAARRVPAALAPAPAAAEVAR
jgi:methylthioribose-1-phosphate isomerase